MNAIEIKGLCKSYKDFKIDNIDLTLPGGCVVGLIGENGAGKSTTIKLILNIAFKDSGTIKILGKDNEKELDLVKEDIGVVFDESYFTTDAMGTDNYTEEYYICHTFEEDLVITRDVDNPDVEIIEICSNGAPLYDYGPDDLDVYIYESVTTLAEYSS